MVGRLLRSGWSGGVFVFELVKLAPLRYPVTIAWGLGSGIELSGFWKLVARGNGWRWVRGLWLAKGGVYEHGVLVERLVLFQIQCNNLDSCHMMGHTPMGQNSSRYALSNGNIDLPKSFLREQTPRTSLKSNTSKQDLRMEGIFAVTFPGIFRRGISLSWIRTRKRPRMDGRMVWVSVLVWVR